MAGTREGQETRHKAWREQATKAIIARLREIGAPPDGFAAFEPGGSRWAGTGSAGAGGAASTPASPPEEFYEWFSGMLPPTPVPGVDYWDPLREGLVQALQWAAKERGEDISLWDFCQLARVTDQLIKDRFGSWGRLRASVGLPPPAGRPQIYDDAEIIAAVRQLAAEAGPHITFAMLHQRIGISTSTVHSRFGGWSKLCEAAGVAVRTLGRRSRHTPESLLQALIGLLKSGRTRISRCDFSRQTGISKDAILSHWGSWSALREAAGLSPQEVSRPRFSDDDLLAEFDRVMRKLGRFPSEREFDAEACCAMFTLRRRLGRRAELLQRWQEWQSRQPARKRPPHRKKPKRQKPQTPSRSRKRPRATRKTQRPSRHTDRPVNS
ncbi:MAG: hypothetical protein KY476_03330 [Planctomycetes bacterium]|nr:hypothetical protein [Planctomycetota bacterium]